MADKPAGAVEQSDWICLCTLKQCGTLAMTTGSYLIFIFMLTYEAKRLKDQEATFFLPLTVGADYRILTLVKVS